MSQTYHIQSHYFLQCIIMAIEDVEIPDKCTTEQKIKLLEAREDYWIATLKSKRVFGGLK